MENNIPNTPVDDGNINNNPLVSANSPQIKNAKFKYLIFSSVAILLIFSISTIYLFWWVPQAQAKEYIQETSKDFGAIQVRLQTYESAFNPLTKSFEVSQTAFFEISTRNRSYLDSVEDTKQDIEDIEATLELINEARNTKNSLTVPESLIYLDQKLDLYYELVEKSMILLMEFEQLQTKMLTASGIELNQELLKIEKRTLDSFSGTPRHELVDYFNNTSTLARNSVVAFDEIDPIPTDLSDYHKFMRDYHQDLAETSQAIVLQLESESSEGDKEVSDIILKFSNRNIEREEVIKDMSKNFTEKSPIKALFEEAIILENEISSEITLESEKYKLIIDTENSEATPSAQPLPTHVEASTPSATLDLSPVTQGSASAN